MCRQGCFMIKRIDESGTSGACGFAANRESYAAGNVLAVLAVRCCLGAAGGCLSWAVGATDAAVVPGGAMRLLVKLVLGV